MAFSHIIYAQSRTGNTPYISTFHDESAEQCTLLTFLSNNWIYLNCNFQVMLECAGLSQPIFMITGSCQGIEITLDNESLPFGAVMIGSRSARQLIMHNSGDVGAAFAWNSDKFAPDFSITPSKGYISPGMEVSFQIVFHPTTVNHDIRYEVLLVF